MEWPTPRANRNARALGVVSTKGLLYSGDGMPSFSRFGIDDTA